MFLCIASGDHSKLPGIGIKFQAREGNQRCLLLCLDHFFSTPIKIQAARTKDVSNTLSMFHRYVSLLRMAAWETKFTDRFQQLFGFKVSEDHTYFLRTGTFLHRCSLSARISDSRSDETGITVSEWDFFRVYRNYLLERLRSRILQENEVCQKTQAFAPCINYSLSGQCNRTECQHAHIPTKDLTVEWYNARLGLYFIQIQILQVVELNRKRKYDIQRLVSFPDSAIVAYCQPYSYWLGQLYEALHPAFFKHGSAANLVLNKVPEARRAFPIVKEWIWDVLSMVEPDYQSRFQSRYLTTVVRTVMLGFAFDLGTTIHCLSRAKCYNLGGPELLLRPGSTRTIIYDLLVSLHFDNSASLSAGILFFG